MSAIITMLLFLWEFPQNILGVANLLIHAVRGSIVERSFERSRMFIKVRSGAVSLGFFIFWSDVGNGQFLLDERNKHHEYGHSVQSRILGPLYLLVVGIPSVSRVAYAHRYYTRQGARWTGYYEGYPENWADRLGKVRSSNA
jgi:hypothetical protein